MPIRAIPQHGGPDRYLDPSKLTDKQRDNLRDELEKQGGYKDAQFIAHARMDIPALLAMVRERDAALERVEEVLVRKYKLYAAICGNTCNKDIMGVDHDAIADEVVAAIRAAITATGGASIMPMWEAMDCPDVTDDPFYADFTPEVES
jgi:hypothetical protein